ncbi:MAG: hypothetical protein ACOZBZ_00985 [Patescibacteria group bacterium]
MKDYIVRVAKIVGSPAPNFWSQVHTFFPEDQKKRNLRGIFLGVLSFSGKGEGVEAVSVGREILSRLHEEYYGELETPAMEKLKQAVSKVVSEFSRPGEGQSLKVVAGVVLGDVLYLTSSGLGQAWIKRGGLMQMVLESSESEVETASGFLEEGDFIVLGTNSFFDLLPQGVLRAALENETPQEAVEALVPVIHGKEEASSACALVGKIEASLEFAAVEPEKHLNSLLVFLKSKLPTFRLEEIHIRDKSQEIKRKKVIFSVALILIFLLGISIIFGVGRRGSRERENRFNLLYSEARKELEEGKALVTLNPTQARQLILRAKEKLSEAENLKIQSIKTQELKQEIENALGAVVKEHKFSELPTFLDLALFKEGGRGENLSLSGNFLSVLDPRENRLFGIDISRKSGEILAGGEDLAGSKLITSYGDYIFVLGEKGVVRVGAKSKKSEIVVKPEENLRNIKSMEAFAGNLYLLDQAEIWRYQATEEGFGLRQKWFGGNIKPDLSQAVSMAIDGSIWLLRQDGKILKFSQGAPSTFGIAGLDKPFSEARVIYTDSEAENLYILDKGESRVVVLTKGGEYQAQYIWEGIKKVSDMVVSESEGRIFLLADNKLYAIEIKK